MLMASRVINGAATQKVSQPEGRIVSCTSPPPQFSAIPHESLLMLLGGVIGHSLEKT
jgi:hypothetical protein